MGAAELTIDGFMLVVGFALAFVGIANPQLPLLGYQLDSTGRIMAVLVGVLLVGGAIAFAHIEGSADIKERKAVALEWGSHKRRR